MFTRENLTEVVMKRYEVNSILDRLLIKDLRKIILEYLPIREVFLRKIPLPNFHLQAMDIYWDRIYLIDRHSNIQILNYDGKILEQFSVGKSTRKCRGLAVSESLDNKISNTCSNKYSENKRFYLSGSGNRVTVFEGKKKVIWKPSLTGSMHSIVLHKDKIYLADRRNNEIKILSLNGSLIHSFKTFGEPVGLTVNSEYIIVLRSTEIIEIFNHSGMPLCDYRIYFHSSDFFDLSISLRKEIYLTSCHTPKILNGSRSFGIYVFNLNGQLLRSFGTQKDGYSWSPQFIKVSKNYIVVNDRVTNDLYIFGIDIE